MAGKSDLGQTVEKGKAVRLDLEQAVQKGRAATGLTKQGGKRSPSVPDSPELTLANLKYLADLGDYPDPLEGIEERQTGDLETDVKEEVGELLQGLRAAEKRDNRRFDLAVNTRTWFVVCFQSEEQKLAFLDHKGWREHGDLYLNGLVLALLEGLELEIIELPGVKVRIDEDYQKMADDMA